MISRRRMLGSAGALVALSSPSWATALGKVVLESRPWAPEITTAFPQKGPMLLQRTRPPLLETPWDVFDKSVFTPNDQFYVRWHWAVIPTSIDADSYKLNVHGHVNAELSLSLRDIVRDFETVELAAVNQCSGNSRAFFEPQVPGAEWGNGAMGNALWRGVRLKDVLDRAGVKGGAAAVRLRGLDEPVVADAPHFMKSLAVDHARDGEVMIAYASNGAQLPLLNGFPLRLVVPGWYSTYWIKMLSDIEVLDKPDDNYWMKTAYKVPDTPHANMIPGEKDVPMVPISRMVPRSFVTNLASGAKVPAGKAVSVRGIAFGGDCGVATIDVSVDGGKTWQPARLGKDEGRYGFRQWNTDVAFAAQGKHAVMVRCTNTDGVSQPATPNWNPGGYMRNVIETTELVAV
jgi:DMSO/TMAO reductase YedYZ molybdopterin-dependent catalytic subunit